MRHRSFAAATVASNSSREPVCLIRYSLAAGLLYTRLALRGREFTVTHAKHARFIIQEPSVRASHLLQARIGPGALACMQPRTETLVPARSQGYCLKLIQ